MKKVRLSENDLTRLVKRVIKEQQNSEVSENCKITRTVDGGKTNIEIDCEDASHVLKFELGRMISRSPK
jgi:hypothetical protein